MRIWKREKGKIFIYMGLVTRWSLHLRRQVREQAYWIPAAACARESGCGDDGKDMFILLSDGVTESLSY